MSKPPPQRSDYGSGCYRRAITLREVERGDGRGEVRGELADDFHHFRVRVRHDGAAVVGIEGEDVRVPWTTCPGALAPLQRMLGASIDRRAPDLLGHTPVRAQCTHLHDLACLAIAHAGRVAAGGAPRRRYDARVPDRVERATRATLERDGEPLLVWPVKGRAIEGATPPRFDGMPLSGTAFHLFLRKRLAAEPELAEAAFVLHRALFIGSGRRHDFEAMADATAFGEVVGAACHTFDPARIGDAKRVPGTVRDFTDVPGPILEDDDSR